MKEKNIYTYRHIARVVIEAVTPIAVGTGDKDFITDAPVITDVNGLPYIPGTSIAGVIRHAVGEQEAKKFFGFNDRNKSANSRGSEIIFTDAVMIGHDGKAVEGLMTDKSTDKFYQGFKSMPIRQHNRIGHKGVVEDAGKFDGQVCYKGARFCFEIEKVSEKDKDSDFETTINKLYSNELRLGSDTRSGLGEVNVVSCKTVILNLLDAEDLDVYINKSSSLREDKFWEKIDDAKAIESKTNWEKYQLNLTPDDFFLFGSGFGSDDADMTPVRESVITWSSNGTPKFEDKYTLIPASSVKGALSHRVAFHYNKLTGIFAEELKDEDIKNHVGDKNLAVRALFGRAGEKEGEQEIGSVISSDVLQYSTLMKPKILNHVAIDRFTGGAIDGALFQEEVLYGKDAPFSLTFYLDKDRIDSKLEAINSKDKKETIIKAFELGLNDICTGMLPLGGGVNRGHGSFNGEIIKDNITLNLDEI